MNILRLVDKKINDACIDIGTNARKIDVDIWNLSTERRVCGVYIIVTKRGVYVGRSIDVWKRLRTNITNGNICKKNMEEIIGTVVYIVDSEYNARFLERILLDSDLNIVNRFMGRKKTMIKGIKGGIIERTGIWRVSVWKRYKRLKIV